MVVNHYPVSFPLLLYILLLGRFFYMFWKGEIGR
jgi:hypothetical protein